jgi:hypothetical protein
MRQPVLVISSRIMPHESGVIANLAKTISEAAHRKNEPHLNAEDHRRLVDEFAVELRMTMEARFNQPVLPTNRETSVVTITERKTAALFFDRVWQSPVMEPIPREIGFYGASDAEILLSARALVAGGGEIDLLQNVDVSPLAEIFSLLDPGDEDETYLRVLALAFEKKTGISVIPMYDSLSMSLVEYKPGDRRTLLASVANMDVIDDARLTWEQVREIRKDNRSIGQVRALRHWLDTEMVGKPLPFVTDELAKRLEDYRWGLKKHGIKTVTGSLQSILDPKFLSATAVASTGIGFGFGHGAAAVVAALAVSGKVLLSVVEKFVDLEDVRRSSGSEIAFIHDVSNKTK